MAFPLSEPITGEVDGGQTAQLAGALYNCFDQMGSCAEKAKLVELASIMVSAGKRRDLVLALAHCAVEH